jgi:hypothetical protein
MTARIMRSFPDNLPERQWIASDPPRMKIVCLTVFGSKMHDAYGLNAATQLSQKRAEFFSFHF